MAGHKFSPVEGDLGDLLRKVSNKYNRDRYLNVDGCILYNEYKNISDAIENFDVRDDDVWVCGFPKTGTTWAQEMIWGIVKGLGSERSNLPIHERFPLLENICLMVEGSQLALQNPEKMLPLHSLADTINFLKNNPNPRFIKSHLPPHLLPKQLRTGEKKPKIIYICRDPKDTCISYYHFYKLFFGFEGSFEELCDLFLGDTVLWGSFWKHVLAFWNKKNDYNMLFLRYEDLKKDLPAAIKTTATFLGKDIKNDQLSSLTRHLSFSSMKKNPAVNNKELAAIAQTMFHFELEGSFIRKGTTGQWKTDMTPEIIRRFDERTSQHFDGTGLSF